MARIRTIKPEFFRHEGLQDLERAHPGKCPMLVFAGLFGHCDKGGVFEWKPRSLKLDILPFLDFDMGETLELLREAGQLQQFEVEGKLYGHIKTFTDHQSIGGKEATAPVKFPRPNGERTGKESGSSREVTGTAGREGKGIGREGNGLHGPGTSPSLPQSQEPIDTLPVMDRIKAVYPAGLHRGDHWGLAEREIWKLLDSGVAPQELVDAAATYCAQQKALGRIGTEGVLRPSNFFNGSGAWRGPFPLPAPQSQKPTTRMRTAHEIAEALDPNNTALGAA